MANRCVCDENYNWEEGPCDYCTEDYPCDGCDMPISECKCNDQQEEE